MVTTLDVLNHMLNVIGEDPVSDPESTHPSVISARVQVDRVQREFQARGWWFNTEFNLKLNPNELGHILIPTDTLYIDSVDRNSRLVRRGVKLYDPVNHTFVINQPVVVNAVLMLPIEDLPENAGAYLLHQAAYDFYVNDDGDETKAARLQLNRDNAWGKLQQEDLKVQRLSAQDRPAVAELAYRMQQANRGSDPTWPGGRR